ncbi:MAG TPA: helix-turn-helix domain-containing protein [Marmoricola sp.]|nr:helix-turn-helix domain-containing protein [Marmoricola sp.]
MATEPAQELPTSAVDALARIDALHSALTQIVLEGGDLGQVAAETARLLDVGVLVTSTDGRERAAAALGDARSVLDDADLVDPTGRFRVERVSGQVLPLASGELRMLRVAAGGTDLARLVCLRRHGQISPDDVHALERAAAVAALVITHQEAVTAVENKYRGDFLRDVFLGRAGDQGYVVEHAETFGWDLQRPMVVVAAEIDPQPPGEEPAPSALRRRWQERFAHAWRQVSVAHDPRMASVDFSSEVVTLPAVPAAPGGTDDVMAAAGVVVHALVTAVTGDRGGGRRPFSVGVSRVAHTVDELPQAYAQARRAVEVGRRVHGSGSTTWFDQLGIHRLIALVPDDRELAAFARDVLGELSADTHEARDLRQTLQVLLDTNFNVAEAARLQFFHYNTMRYRVAKLERLLGPLGHDPHLRLDVAVALKVLEILA